MNDANKRAREIADGATLILAIIDNFPHYSIEGITGKFCKEYVWYDPLEAYREAVKLLIERNLVEEYLNTERKMSLRRIK